MNHGPTWGLFDVFGVEIEYMIVGENLSVLPITDRVLQHVAGTYETEIVRGDISWSNELALHVIELKTTEPAARLSGLAEKFTNHVRQINQLLAAWQGRLMPTAMHPWMDPHRDLKLWPHDYNEVYESFHRIFNCQGHGWANLQSMHLNLPFANDEQFGKLHAAIRAVLPILPGLAASSPIADGRLTGQCDTRLAHYRNNAARLPLVTASVVPEAVFTPENYQREILQPMYRQIAPFDPDGILQHEWLNARGAIARFERNSIEVRVLDSQECPAADLAIAQLVVAALQAMVDQQFCDLATQQQAPTNMLADLMDATIRQAEHAIIDDPRYRALWGLEATPDLTVHELWRTIADRTNAAQRMEPACRTALDTILQQGTLATRIVRALRPPTDVRTVSPDFALGGIQAGDPRNKVDDLDAIRDIYAKLCQCLEEGTVFDPS